MRETAFTQALAGVLKSEALGGWVRQRVWEGLVGCVVDAAKENDQQTVKDLLARVPSPQHVAAERTEVLWCPSKLELRPDIVVSDEKRYVIFELKLWGGWNAGKATEAAEGASSSQGESQATDYRWLAVQQACGRGTLRVHLGVHPVKERKWISITWAEVGRALRRVLKTLQDEGRATTPAEVLEVMPLLALCVGIERQLLGLPAPRADRETPSSTASLRDDWTSVEPAARVVEYLGPMKDEAMSKTATPQPDEVTAAYIDNFVALDAGRRQFEVWRSQVMSRLDVVVSSALEKAKCPALNKKYTEGGGTMWGYYLPTPRAFESPLSAAPSLAYTGFWMGFIAGTSYGPCDEDGKCLDPSSDPLADKLVFRTDLWFNTATSDPHVIRVALAAIQSSVSNVAGLKLGNFGFESSKTIFLPVHREAVRGDDDFVGKLEETISRLAELHAALIAPLRLPG